MNAPLAKPVHSDVGGSVAGRVLRCPASVPLTAKVPAHLRKSSIHAERGTALHSAMALLLGDNPPSFESLAGKTFNGYTITSDDVENALRPVFAYVAALLETPGAEFFSEKRLAFPTVPGAFGTADLLVRIGATGHTVDYKFGGGVRVLALHPDGDEDVINAQSLFYTAGARYSEPKFFARVDTFVLTILQPQSIEPDAEMVSTAQVTPAEVDEFITRFRAACEEARAPEPRLERGDHCRFCPARPLCPLHTGPLLDLGQFEVPTPSTPDYLRLLARGLDLVDAVKDLGRALRDQATQALHAGDLVPGFALTGGRAERHWRDDEPAAIAALQSLGLSRDDVVAETMRSPKQVELRAKARGLKVPSEFVVSARSGTSLVRAQNARALVPGRSEIARSFSAALNCFQKGSERS